jgi:PPK2 family polyphosphate:nucleotide phosphotransferase
MALLHKLDGSKKIKLADIDSDQDAGLTREEAAERQAALTEELSAQQELLYAAQETPLLILLQGMDAAGKDGTIKNVLGAMNPQGCRVASFKAPTPVELAHDFLWRVHSETPGKGEVVIFNRSHYEDVLIVRVHGLVPEKVWRKRYDHINAFEHLLADNDTVILKFFLHISKDEQERRLLDREKDPLTYWKLSLGDWKERERWDDYQAAYEDALNQCALPHAPWYVVPANKKWFRNLAIAETLVETLRPLKENWVRRLKTIGVEELKALRASRQSHR